MIRYLKDFLTPTEIEFLKESLDENVENTSPVLEWVDFDIYDPVRKAQLKRVLFILVKGLQSWYRLIIGIFEKKDGRKFIDTLDKQNLFEALELSLKNLKKEILRLEECLSWIKRIKDL